MDVFLTIRRKKTTIFVDAKEDTTVHELKRMIEGIVKHTPDDMRLYRIGTEMPMDDKTKLSDAGFTSATARAQEPAQIGLALRVHGGDFETVEVTPYSLPPELPDVMKPQENGGVRAGIESSPA